MIPDMVQEQDRVSGNAVSGGITTDILLPAFDRCIPLESVHRARQGDSDPCSHFSPFLLIYQQYSL